jgi:hypothetical protein
MASNSLSAWLRQRGVAPRQAAALALLLAVAVGLWARMALFSGASSAQASIKAPARKSVKPVRPVKPQASSEETTPRSIDREKVYLALHSDLSRDLFNARLDAYRRVKEETAPVIKEEPKSAPAISDDQRKAEELRAALKGLKLDSTVTGQAQFAVINGQPYRPGERVGRLELVEVRPRSVVLRMNGLEVELEIGL